MSYESDLMNAGLLSGGAQGFIKGMQDAHQRQQDDDDRKLRRIEMEAKLKSQDDDRKRQAFMDAVSMRKMGFMVPSGPMDYEQPPQLDPAKVKSDAILSAGEKHIIPTFDDQGNVTSTQMDPNYAAFLRQGKSASIENQQDTKDRREHENILRRVAANPQVRQRLTQYQNLDNSLSLLANADHLTPQQFAEAQQSIRSNLGIKGGSGVGEREETYLKSVGLNAEAFKQFLTGNPADVDRNSPLVQHVKNLAAIEQSNIRKQFDQSLKAAAGGHGSMYSRRADLRGDLEDYLKGIGDQMQTNVEGQAPQGKPQGLVRQGLINRIGGLLGLSSGTAPVTNEGQDPQTAQWAAAHNLDYATAARILEKRKAGK